MQKNKKYRKIEQKDRKINKKAVKINNKTEKQTIILKNQQKCRKFTEWQKKSQKGFEKSTKRFFVCSKCENEWTKNCEQVKF